MEDNVIFQPLQFRNLRVKNRLFRSNISGRFDNYNGTGTQTRINWRNRSLKAAWAPSFRLTFL
jgi:2,4-dienoyl-CoA reductase-like NADH-dependent reductase (Old Yellow Enzyme family)